jgi:hypothetical protein
LHEGTAVSFTSINGVFILCKGDSRIKCPYGPARFEREGADSRSREKKEAFRLIAWQAALREAKDRAVRVTCKAVRAFLSMYQQIHMLHGSCCASARSSLECTASLVRPRHQLVGHLVIRRYTGTSYTKESRLESIILRHLNDASYRTRVEKHEDH